MRTLLAVLFALSIAPALAETWQDADAKIAACFTEMDKDPALAVVNAKFARRAPSAAQVSDRSLASDVEAEALRLRIAKTRPCREMRLAAVRKYHPLIEPAYTTLYYQADQVFDYLMNGAVSYGTANRLSAVALGDFEARSRDYFAAADTAKRRALALFWLDALQRAHSDPPPPASYRDKCHWRVINIECN